MTVFGFDDDRAILPEFEASFGWIEDDEGDPEVPWAELSPGEAMARMRDRLDAILRPAPVTLCGTPIEPVDDAVRLRAAIASLSEELPCGVRDFTQRWELLAREIEHEEHIDVDRPAAYYVGWLMDRAQDEMACEMARLVLESGGMARIGFVRSPMTGVVVMGLQMRDHDDTEFETVFEWKRTFAQYPYEFQRERDPTPFWQERGAPHELLAAVGLSEGCRHCPHTKEEPREWKHSGGSGTYNATVCAKTGQVIRDYATCTEKGPTE